MASQVSNSDIEAALQSFARKRTLLRLTFAVLLLFAFLATIFVVKHSASKANEAENRANLRQKQVEVATQNLMAIAATTLAEVGSLDRQAKQIAQSDLPTAYLWRAGYPVKRNVAGKTELALLSVLHDRRLALGDAGPILSSSPDLEAYVCEHPWYLVVESVPIAAAKDYLANASARDPRFRIAEAGVGNVHPSFAGIMIGFFLTEKEAKKLKSEVPQDAFLKAWDFKQYQPPCLAQLPH